MAKRQKYYVVWKGREPGVYSNWADCQAQIAGFPGAEYKSFARKDEALEAFGDILKRQTRDSDIAGRYGGEEFLAILPSSNAEGARQYAERVRESLARHELPSGTRITVSAGVAVSGPTMNDASELVRAADAALYQAKAAGGNRVDPGPARPEAPAPADIG